MYVCVRWIGSHSRATRTLAAAGSGERNERTSGRTDVADVADGRVDAWTTVCVFAFGHLYRDTETNEDEDGD